MSDGVIIPTFSARLAYFPLIWYKERGPYRPITQGARGGRFCRTNPKPRQALAFSPKRAFPDGGGPGPRSHARTSGSALDLGGNPGPGAEQAHGSVACVALILQSALQIPDQALEPIDGRGCPEIRGWRESAQNPIDLVDADPLEAAGRQAEHGATSVLSRRHSRVNHATPLSPGLTRRKSISINPKMRPELMR